MTSHPAAGVGRHGPMTGSDSESKHTPGPWAIGPSHNDEYLGPPGEIAIMGGDGACVAVAIPTGARGDRLPELTAANARLIAAAPDYHHAATFGASKNLPDFLDWIAERLVHVHGESPNVDYVLSLRERANLTRAAISKHAKLQAMTDTVQEQLARGERAERSLHAALDNERSLLLEIANLNNTNEKLRDALEDAIPALDKAITLRRPGVARSAAKGRRDRALAALQLAGVATPNATPLRAGRGIGGGNG